MRVRKIALLGLIAVAACTTETPLTPSAAPPQQRLDETSPPPDTTGKTGTAAGGGLLGSGH